MLSERSPSFVSKPPDAPPSAMSSRSSSIEKMEETSELLRAPPLTRKITESTQLLREAARELSKPGNKLKKLAIETSQDVFELDSVPLRRTGSSAHPFISTTTTTTKKKKPIAIFKPQGRIKRTSTSCKFAPGTAKDVADAGSIRERLAYLLDRNAGYFCGVPAVALVNMTARASLDRKTSVSFDGVPGSFQRYVAHTDSAEDVGSSLFPIDQVQKIAAMDLRLFNTDRNASNILVSGRPYDKATLFPIDHALTLPEITRLGDRGAYFCWANWPQAKKKFSANVKRYIREIDAEADLKISLLKEAFHPRALVTLRLCARVLKMCALDLECTPYEIAQIYQRQGDMDSPSVLESAVLRSDGVYSDEFYDKVLADIKQAVLRGREHKP